MKISIIKIVSLTLLLICNLGFAQNNNGNYPNTFTSGSTDISPFTNASKRFNDWSVSFGGGIPMLQQADLTSIKTKGNGKTVFGYSLYLSVDKAITHSFGLSLQYDRGETRQGAFNTKTQGSTNGSIAGRTQYNGLSVIGDLNITNLLRRVDNLSPYRWNFHGYLGVGLLGYKAYQANSKGEQLMTDIKTFSFGSVFAQTGAGLKFKISRRLDVEGRVMYVVTGDDTFDGGGDQYSNVNAIYDRISDNFINATVGLTVKLGKHESHLYWHDPLQEIYYKLDVLANANPDVEVCKKGDNDNDGVCDDWDRQLDTPAGARVDGAGVALDSDLDGVIDLYDNCVMIPGPVDNKGCPVTNNNVTVTNVNLDGIQFNIDSYEILSSNTSILDNVINYINTTSEGSYLVIGGADTRGTVPYNQKLSEKRANTVKNYLIQHGVNSSKLQAIGRGEKDLKYPECDPYTKCPEWKNRANRRVYFEAK